MSIEIQSTDNLTERGAINVITYGRPGVGKTHAIRTTDAPTLVLSSEGGEVSLADVSVDYTRIDTVDSLTDAYRFLSKSDHEYRWAALDSVSEMAQMILEYELEQTKHGQQAYGSMADRVRKLMRRFRGLEMNVYFTAKQARDDSGPMIKKAPDFPGNSLNANNSIAHDFDLVFPFIVTDELSAADESLTCDDGRYRYFLTEPQDEWIASKRDPHGVLDPREPVDLSAIRAKVLGGGDG